MTENKQRVAKYQAKLKERGLNRSSLLWDDKTKKLLQKKADELQVPMQELLMHLDVNLKSHEYIV